MLERKANENGFVYCYDVDYILSKVVFNKPTSDSKKASDTDIDGDFIYMNSYRYQTFAKSKKCCICGLEGSYFIKEKRKEDKRYHLNLYGVDSNGNEVMLTKDHIIPKSKGGTDTLDNFKTMCSKCNVSKDNKKNVIDINDIKSLVKKLRNQYEDDNLIIKASDVLEFLVNRLDKDLT